MSDAEQTAADLRTEGVHLAGNLRDLSEALTANAERLLRDVQTVHARMVAQIERLERATNRSGRSEPE
jgi:hypothetical protein